MPIFMDRHDLGGLTSQDVAEAHQRDVALQEKYGVRSLTHWFDEVRGHVFCLFDAPSAEAVCNLHVEAHDQGPNEIIEVDLSAVMAFLGRTCDRNVDVGRPLAMCEPAVRAVMFTDIVESTDMAVRLGDQRALEMVRVHDLIVRNALRRFGGREVKHTGDGIMASFDSADDAVACACAIMQSLWSFNEVSKETLSLRIGIHAGEPVQDNDDLFGTTIQMAARICSDASVDSVVISETVCNLAEHCPGITPLGRRVLRGFHEPVPLYAVDWRARNGS